MGYLTAVSPVPPSVALRFGGGRAFLRKALLHQTRIGQAIAFLEDGEPVALAMLDCRRARRAELCLRFEPRARPHMRALIREAQLTLPAMAETRTLIFARIRPGNPSGERMARLVGFRPGRFKDRSIWLWKG